MKTVTIDCKYAVIRKYGDGTKGLLTFGCRKEARHFVSCFHQYECHRIRGPIKVHYKNDGFNS